ncbi:MAG: hypothetical protein U1E10_06795 [Bdellovibrionales bacterium]|jgi:hypothetical protein|nr:hypothetical protein [Bdellovibrionales bacterium]
MSQGTRQLFLIAAAITYSTLSADYALGCMGGQASFANAVLRAGHVTVGDTTVPFPVVNPGNANKVLPDPIQLVGSKTLKVHVLYIETTAKYEIASVIYKVEQEGYPPTTVRVKSNVSASGVRTRSLAPQPADIEREPLPTVNDVFDCGGSERARSSGGAIGR